jgi:hypothetical protein
VIDAHAEEPEAEWELRLIRTTNAHPLAQVNGLRPRASSSIFMAT